MRLKDDNNQHKRCLNNENSRNRLLNEERFHDSKFNEKYDYPAHYNLHPTYEIFKFTKKMMGDIKNLNVLEYGCGTGWVTGEIASTGAHVYSFDISNEAIMQTKDYLKERKLDEKCNLRRMSAERLKYEKEQFDVVVGFAILHHLDLNLAITELFRVMKYGGKAFFAEPLAHNPFIKLYRKLTPQYRSPDEMPLNMDDFSKYTKLFNKYYHKEFFLFGLGVLGMAHLKIFNNFVKQFFTATMKFDQKIFQHFPKIGKYAWYTLITLEK